MKKVLAAIFIAVFSLHTVANGTLLPDYTHTHTQSQSRQDKKDHAQTNCQVSHTTSRQQRNFS